MTRQSYSAPKCSEAQAQMAGSICWISGLSIWPLRFGKTSWTNGTRDCKTLRTRGQSTRKCGIGATWRPFNHLTARNKTARIGFQLAPAISLKWSKNHMERRMRAEAALIISSFSSCLMRTETAWRGRVRSWRMVKVRRPVTEMASVGRVGIPTWYPMRWNTSQYWDSYRRLRVT